MNKSSSRHNGGLGTNSSTGRLPGCPEMRVNTAVLRVPVISLDSHGRAHWVLAGPRDIPRYALVILAGPWRPPENSGTQAEPRILASPRSQTTSYGSWQPPLYLLFSGAVSGWWSSWLSDWCWFWAMISRSGWGYLAVDFFRWHLESWALRLPGKAWTDMAVLSLWQRRGWNWNAEGIGLHAPAIPHPQVTQEGSGFGNSIACPRLLRPSGWKLAFRPGRWP